VIAHIVLFKPRGDVSPGARDALADAFAAAVAGIPSVRRARLGRRHTHQRPGYQQLMRVDYEFAAVIEFDDAAGLQAYLAHPLHETLAERFFAVFENALMYDYELEDGTAGVDRLR
jgi:hypothetical protein